MYSQNDYRYYLAHGKWQWPNGKNSPAYNHDYYQKHKEQWKAYADNAKKKAKDIIGIGAKEDLMKKDRSYKNAQRVSEYRKKQWEDQQHSLYYYDKETDRYVENNDPGELRNVRKAYNSYRAADQRVTDTGRHAGNAARHYYDHTILGVTESAYDRGKEAFNDALDKIYKKLKG